MRIARPTLLQPGRLLLMLIALVADALVIGLAIALMAIGSGYGMGIEATWGGWVVFVGVAGALLLPVPLVLFWVLLYYASSRGRTSASGLPYSPRRSFPIAA